MEHQQMDTILGSSYQHTSTEAHRGGQEGIVAGDIKVLTTRTLAYDQIDTDDRGAQDASWMGLADTLDQSRRKKETYQLLRPRS